MVDGTTQPLQPLSVDEDSFLRALGRVMIALPRAVDLDMTREQRLSVTEYTTLMHLSEASNQLMRMSDLAAACNLSLSGATRVVTRLTSEGLVQRVRCEDDARGWNAVLTDAGLARLEKAYPSNLASVRRHIFDHLEGVDIVQFTRALNHFASAG
jgi:DNA-binding MarR family transcriptional regulator